MTEDNTTTTPVYDEETARALRLLVLLARAAESVAEHARRHAQERGLSISEFGVLELLYHKGPTPLSAIAGKLLLTSGSITYVVDQLEKKGLVRRVACPKDRRVLYGDLTEEGRRLIAEVFPCHASRIVEAVSGLTAEEQRTACELLKKLGLTAREKSGTTRGRGASTNSDRNS